MNETTDPAYDRAHHVFFAKDAALNAWAKIRDGHIYEAHHELERAMNELGAVMDIDGAANPNSPPE